MAGCMRRASPRSTTVRVRSSAEDVIAWVQESQPEAWQALAKGHGLDAEKRLLERLRAQDGRTRDS